MMVCNNAVERVDPGSSGMVDAAGVCDMQRMQKDQGSELVVGLRSAIAPA